MITHHFYPKTDASVYTFFTSLLHPTLTPSLFPAHFLLLPSPIILFPILAYSSFSFVFCSKSSCFLQIFTFFIHSSSGSFPFFIYFFPISLLFSLFVYRL
ncbi:hypothetical protein Csa_011207 [Cucumis sativus]|uniref:Uncharacterized protein n=1 Tax=Cucumis sativus TaxID=3659 RepID=A0A0A0L7Z1_CUCSA|nr:hypothetical protein Csa_011207 [Cucumis sativus]